MQSIFSALERGHERYWGFLNGVHTCKVVIFWFQHLLEFKKSACGSTNLGTVSSLWAKL